MKKLIYKKSNRNIIKEIILLIMIISLSIFMIITFEGSTTVFLFLPLILISLFFLIATAINRNKPTVIVDSNGIKSKVNGMGIVEWKFVQEIKIVKGIRTTFLVVKINEVDDFLKNKSKISQKLMKSNIGRLGSPCVIPETQFEKPLVNVVNEIKRYQAVSYTHLTLPTTPYV